MSYYGKVYTKSTVTTRKNYASVEGEGGVRSNDLYIARTLSEGLIDAVNHSNQIAYEAHMRSRK
jgi:hypothetical protein